MKWGAYRDRGDDAAEDVTDDRADGMIDPAVGFGIGVADDDAIAEPARATARERIVLGLFAAAAVAWLAVAIVAGVGALRGGPDLGTLVRGAAIASGPLALLAGLAILWQRNGPREASRFADAAQGIRRETLALDTVLGLASRRLADDRAAVAAEADRLVALADESSARMREAADGMAREIAALGRRAREIDEAAGTARVDMGVLLADLPVAEGQVRALADELRATGLAAHEQASAFQATLAGLASRAKEAEEANGGAANRLAAQAARIASASEAATRGIAEAQGLLGDGIDGVLDRAARAMERTHGGIVAQGEAIDAMIARAAAGADAAAARAGEVVGGRIAALAAEIEALGAALADRDGAGDAAVERIRQGLVAIEARFAELDETGRARTERLGDALGQLSAHAEKTMAALHGGGTAATALINRAETLREGLRASLADLDETLPGALDRLDARVSATGPEIERIGAAVAQAADAIARAGDDVSGRQTAMEALAAALTERLAAARETAAALDEAVSSADARAAKLADGTTPKLVDALVRVRETGTQAADRAREALAAIVPDASRAIEAAVSGAIETEVARVRAAGDRAAGQAREAAERIEAGLKRVDEAAAAQGDTLSQRTAQMVDALNSTAIDVSRLLGEDPGDTAWGAYLKGDRGVFTRRAVRLLDAGEARAVAARYGEDEAFRAEVNRYVHDFEALLRPVLATREGSTLAVVLLSSDMGKLYVALAQAIERLRA